MLNQLQGIANSKYDSGKLMLIEKPKLIFKKI